MRLSAIWQPCALQWGPCSGKPLRYVYVDEAGIADDEPVTVVAGIIVEADTQYVLAEKRLAEVLSTVPAHLRTGFISHAKHIYNHPKLRVGWKLTDRIAFMKAMIAIPISLNIPISVAMVRRANPNHAEGYMSRADYHHAMAFGLCVAHADRHVRERGRPEEVITVVSEDAPDNRRRLRGHVKHLRTEPLIVDAASRLEVHGPFIENAGEYRVERVKDVVHFVSKEDGPFLQIADAIAYAMRRFLCGQVGGAELVSGFAPSEVTADDWNQMKFGSFCFVRSLIARA